MLTFPEIVVRPRPGTRDRLDIFHGAGFRENATYLDLRVIVRDAIKQRDRTLWDWFRAIPQERFFEGVHRFDWYGPELVEIEASNASPPPSEEAVLH